MGKFRKPTAICTSKTTEPYVFLYTPKILLNHIEKEDTETCILCIQRLMNIILACRSSADYEVFVTGTNSGNCRNCIM